MFRAGMYARVSTNDQQTLAMQNRAMREYAGRRGWMIALQVREVGSGAAKREARERLLEAARRREIDVVLVWRLDRWGRSVMDLLATLQELNHLGVGFVSMTEALDLTTPAGRAMAGLLAIFAEFEREILRERTRAGSAQARQNGKRLGRPETAAKHAAEVRKLHRAGASKSEIARRLQIGRTSVRRILARHISGRNRVARTQPYRNLTLFLQCRRPLLLQRSRCYPRQLFDDNLCTIDPRR
jgi:putative DNA-invertase from lambdoid prophage Rac